jgi:hypothetical protein
VCPALGELRLVNPQGPPPPASAAARAGAFTGSVGALSGSAGGAAASRRPREGQATPQSQTRQSCLVCYYKLPTRLMDPREGCTFDPGPVQSVAPWLA